MRILFHSTVAVVGSNVASVSEVVAVRKSQVDCTGIP